MQDAYATRNGYPLRDAQQDWKLVSLTRNATHMTGVVERPLNTCDRNTDQDWTITVRICVYVSRIA
jgi:hypothetical protein